MDLSQETLVAVSKTWGLFFLMVFFLCVVAYAFWPSNKKGFDQAKKSIFDRDDRPWKN